MARFVDFGYNPPTGNRGIEQVNPRTFVRKHLIDEFEEDPVVPGPETPYGATQQSTATLAPGESPPWDAEAT